MTIVELTKVREAVKRALQLDPQRDEATAVHAVAASLCLPVEAVQHALQTEREEVEA